MLLSTLSLNDQLDCYHKCSLTHLDLLACVFMACAVSKQPRHQVCLKRSHSGGVIPVLFKHCNARERHQPVHTTTTKYPFRGLWSQAQGTYATSQVLSKYLGFHQDQYTCIHFCFWASRWAQTRNPHTVFEECLKICVLKAYEQGFILWCVNMPLLYSIRVTFFC